MIKEFIWNSIPDFNTLYGFLFYSIAVYLVTMLIGWFAQPTLDASLKNDLKQKEAKAKGKAMRERYKKDMKEKES